MEFGVPVSFFTAASKTTDAILDGTIEATEVFVSLGYIFFFFL